MTDPQTARDAFDALKAAAGFQPALCRPRRLAHDPNQEPPERRPQGGPQGKIARPTSDFEEGSALCITILFSALTVQEPRLTLHPPDLTR